MRHGLDLAHIEDAQIGLPAMKLEERVMIAAEVLRQCGRACPRWKTAAKRSLGFTLNQLSTIAAVTAALVAINAQAADSQSSRLHETVIVCTNLDMYPAMAADNRDEGMPLDIARKVIAASMQKNFEGKLPPATLQPTIAGPSSSVGLAGSRSTASIHSRASRLQTHPKHDVNRAAAR